MGENDRNACEPGEARTCGDNSRFIYQTIQVASSYQIALMRTDPVVHAYIQCICDSEANCAVLL